MAKRKRATTKKQTEKRHKQCRGQGTFDKYQPWLRIQDVGSTGLSTRIFGWKTKRIHHFLSKLELSYFYLLEWSKEVIDIREQFPLDLAETKAIAQELCIKHPTDPRTQESVVMTTDFLITIKKPLGSREIARTIKYAKDLSNKRVLEKFEIERIYWQNRNLSWSVVTEKDIDSIAVENIKWLHACRNKESFPFKTTPELLKKAFQIMTHFFTDEPVILKATRFCDSELNIPSGTSLTIFRHLLANHRWKIDMSKPLNPRSKFYFQNQSSKGGQL